VLHVFRGYVIHCLFGYYLFLFITQFPDVLFPGRAKNRYKICLLKVFCAVLRSNQKYDAEVRRKINGKNKCKGILTGEYWLRLVLDINIFP
jgi:hypothetical protein